MQASRDKSLVIDRGDANAVQDDTEVVADDAVSSPLCEDTQTDTDEQAVAIARGSPQIVPSGVLLGFFFGFECLLNLRHLELNKWVADVATNVDVGKVLARFVNAIDRDQPARRFWNHDQARDTDDWEKYLE